MKYIKNTLRIVVLLLFATVYAQQEPNYSLYRYSMNVINPAYAGADGKTSITANIRSQWVNVQEAPETQSFFFATPLGKRVGIGISVVSDQTFIEKQTSYNVDFSYQLPVSDHTNIYLGLKAGGGTYNLDSNGLSNYSIFPIDPAIENIDDGFNPNFGLGAYLVNDKYFVSLSVPALLKTDSVDSDSGRVSYATSTAHVYFSGGYNFKLSKNTEFRPSTLIRYISGAPLSVDITAAFKFFDAFEVGAAYRTDNAISGLMMLRLANWVNIGYAYESSTVSEISEISNGTHEILFRLNFN